MTRKKTPKPKGRPSKTLPPERRRNLTPLEKHFVNAFDGDDPVEALREAGYKGSDEDILIEAERMMRKPAVRYALRLKEANPLVADKQSLQEWWTELIKYDPMVDVRDKLRASELLAKSQGLLTDRIKHEGPTLEELIKESMKEE